MTTEEIQDLSDCRSNDQGNVLSWSDVRDKWQLSKVEMRQLGRKDFGHPDKPKFEFCGSDESDWKDFLVVFTERRPIEMSEYICKVHGGRLPVPKNEFENKVGCRVLE